MLKEGSTEPEEEIKVETEVDEWETFGDHSITSF